MGTKVKNATDDLVIEAEPEVQAAPALDRSVIAAIPGDDGWYSNADWIRVECDGEGPWTQLAPRDGFEPLWVEIDASLTFQEALAIPLEAGTPLVHIFAAIEPRIRAWNVREYDASTGKMIPVPPPSEIGKAAFMRCRPLVVEWIGYTLRQMTLSGGPNRKNETPPSGDGSDGANADD